MAKPAYPDLQDADFVFDALLGYGMFPDKLPPCFSSENLLEYIKKNPPLNKKKTHAYINYQATRSTNIPRQLAIPHPESYWMLCNCIKENWKKINGCIGETKNRFNFCHVRKIKGKKHIFEMNYSGADKWKKEETILNYSLGCRYVVLTDISTFFPSIYSHSIPWAINGKEWAKRHRRTSIDEKKKEREDCRLKKGREYFCETKDLWPNDLDYYLRANKDGETNGILIGPHASNIISEIILTRVDFELQKQKYMKVIRHIDDYQFFAKDEKEARDFLRTLSLELKKFELELNPKKTEIISYQDFLSSLWIGQLNQFSFPEKKEIGFTSINAYINYAIRLSKEENSFAALNYAIKVVSKKRLSKRARLLYIKKIIQIALDYPYILTLLEDFVFLFANSDLSVLNDFLRLLLDRSLENRLTDALAFVFYYSIKYNIDLGDIKNKCQDIVDFNDCISMLLAYKYYKKRGFSLAVFEEKANEIRRNTERERDKFWLFLYEILDSKKQDPFLKLLKEGGCTFLTCIE